MTSLINITKQLAAELLSQNKSVVTAESCTGGGIAYAFTALAGSSSWFERGFVTYSNAAKINDIAVPASVIELHGAVSEETVRDRKSTRLNSSHVRISYA